jgi:hypothetical protein
MNSTFPHASQGYAHIRLFAHDGATSDAIAVFEKIMDLTRTTLRTAHSDAILDAVEVVRGYAEVWMKYPDVSSVRQEMADALIHLANLMDSAGDNARAKQARWCALFACSRDIETGRVIQPTDLDFRI